MKRFYVYIMASRNGVLYVGVTNDLERRVGEHKQHLVPGFTAKYKVDRLAYYEAFGDVRGAIAREKQIKGWRRARKVALVESVNPTWKDLSGEWHSGECGETSLVSPCCPLPRSLVGEASSG